MCLTKNIAALCNHPYATVPSIMNELAYQALESLRGIKPVT